MARMTALRPGASPPTVLMASRFIRTSWSARPPGTSSRPSTRSRGSSAAPADGQPEFAALGAVAFAVGPLDGPDGEAGSREDVVGAEQAEREVGAGGQHPPRALVRPVQLLARLHAQV